MSNNQPINQNQQVRRKPDGFTNQMINEVEYETEGYTKTFLAQAKEQFRAEMDYYKDKRAGLTNKVFPSMKNGLSDMFGRGDTDGDIPTHKTSDEMQRIVIADAIPDPNDPNYVSVAMVYANDLEAKHKDPRMVNEAAGNYVRFPIDDYNDMMAKTNTSGDYPVIDAPVTQYNDRTAFIQWGKGSTPTDAFNFDAHEANTPNGTVLENKRLGHTVDFSDVVELEHDHELEL